MAYVRAADKYGLSVEKGTDRVPDDGKYHLLVDGEIVLSTTVEALALAEMAAAILYAARFGESIHPDMQYAA
jgi:hypothetical protein